MQLKLIFTFIFITSNSFATTVIVPPVIYGDDNRIDVNDSTVKMYKQLARSTAAMISDSLLRPSRSGEIVLGGYNLLKDGWCKSERFIRQPLASNCSGFLIAKNILVTAGHCLMEERQIKNFSWVFDYKVEHESDEKVIISRKNIYKIKRVISHKLDAQRDRDYAVVELDRDVTDREFLNYRKVGRPMVGDELVVIGTPWGLPTKITDKGRIRSMGQYTFRSNLDTYQGNSGSAVMNSRTGLVEGILVNGEDDYKMDQRKGCRVSNVVSEIGGSGEGVTRITTVPGL